LTDCPRGYTDGAVRHGQVFRRARTISGHFAADRRRRRIVAKTKQGADTGKKKVFVVDDHPIVRERVAELINQEPDLVVCGEAEGAAQALALLAKTPVDVAVVDISLKDGDGLELIKQMSSLYPHVLSLVLSMYDESVAFFEHIVRKDRPVREILTANYTFLNQPLAKFYGVKKEVKAKNDPEMVIDAENRGGRLRAVLFDDEPPGLLTFRALVRDHPRSGDRGNAAG